MLSITQFEVYVLEHGRWTIHARYGSDQRKAAIMDARETEFSTGFPTKVVVETYFPDIDEAELVTIYTSPKAREMRETSKSRRSGRSPMTARPAAVATQSSNARERVPRTGSGVRKFAMQGVAAGALSLVGATISTVVFSWALRHAIEAGLPINPSLSTSILTYAYAVLFIVFFASLFRSRLPLHRMIPYLWTVSASTAPQKAEADAKTIAAALAPRLRPKRSASAVSAEAARAMEEVKLLRGDPKPEPEPQAAVPPPAPATAVPPEPVAAPIAPASAASEKKKQDKKKGPAEDSKKEGIQASPVPSPKNTETPGPQEAADVLAPQRAVLRHFVSQALLPAVAVTMPDDPVTRRGCALVLAGAAAAVADKGGLSANQRAELVRDALAFSGASDATTDMFMHQHDVLIAVPANASLYNFGRVALVKQAAGETIGQVIAAAVAGWRTPFGQPGIPPEKPAALDVTASPKEHSPHDVYLLTELRMGPAFATRTDGTPDSAADTARDAAMGLHNSIVRSVLSTHAGHEIKHTGSGIFSRFGDAAVSMAAAREIQRRFTSTFGPKLAVALIAASSSEDDPLISPNLIHHAQTVAAQACDGEILAERRVHAAVGSTSGTPDTGEADETALIKIALQTESEEAALYQHIPATELSSSLSVRGGVNAS